MAPESIIQKVQLLLAHAGGTENPSEQSLYIQKAQELMTRYAIEEADLEANMKPEDRKKPIMVETTIWGDYLPQLRSFFNALALQNRCKLVYGSTCKRTEGSPTCKIWLFGSEVDIDYTRHLYRTLRDQCFQEMRKTKVPSWEAARAFRINFIMGFRGMIISRLKQAEAHTFSSAAPETQVASSSVQNFQLMTITRSAEIEKLVKESIGTTHTTRLSSPSSFRGAEAGRNAGAKATISRGAVSGRSSIG